MKRSVFCALAISAVVLARAQAQAPPQTGPLQPQQPTFQTSVDLTLVDLRVVDRRGDFVTGLTKDDFRVFEDGTEQAVASVSSVNIQTDSQRARSSRVAPDVASNATADEGRLYLLVLGEGPAALAPTYRALAREFVERHVSDVDQVALVDMSGRRDVNQEFTRDTARLLDAIDTFEPDFGTGSDASRTLTSLIEWLAQVQGRRKTLVFIAENVNSVLNEVNGDPGIDLQRLLTAAARANVSLYIVDPRGVPNGKASGIKPVHMPEDPRAAEFRRQGLRVLAEATGGEAFGTTSNDFAAAFDQIVEQSSSYYLLGYTSTNAKDGKFHKIKVEVKRPNLSVHARSGYTAERPTTGMPASIDGMPRNLAGLLKSPITVSGLTLRMSVAAFRGQGRLTSVTVIVEAQGSDLLFAERDGRFNGAMEIAMVASDSNGRSVGGERGSLKMELLPATHNTIATEGVRILSAIDLKPGKYHFKVAATDAGGGPTRGLVQHDFTVPDLWLPFSMSSVVVASGETMRTLTNGAPPQPWQASLGMPPTTIRSFDQTGELRVYSEIYNGLGQDRRSIVTATVMSSSGRTVFTRRQVVPAIMSSARQGVVTVIPLRDLAPGDYVLEVEGRAVSHPDQPIRRIPFSVR